MFILEKMTSRITRSQPNREEELKELQATLANIEEARPFEDLTVCLIIFEIAFL